MRCVLLTSILASSITAVVAEDRPSTGLVYNATEVHSISYDCRPTSADVIECSFVQTAVRRKADAAELGKKLAEAKAEFAKGTGLIKKEDCDQMDQMLGYFARGEIPKSANSEDAKKVLAGMSEAERKDTAAFLGKIVTACRTPTEANYTNVVREGFDREVRTCKVSAHTYQLTFRRVQGSQAWTSNQGPTGPCGTIVVASFEKAGEGFSLWNYVTQKLITNPRAEAWPGLSCSKLDQAQYRYEWMSRTWYMRCDYVEFSVF